ncbi:L,D-transpeptidase family protein [Conexibacter arvalis]|uniref:Lipoprotein-anchoring transpeptidase ErfK/SrfK n=1 Tax=Conexibacter arvalis TaxID=912552 RepID=A0A840IHE1_9ACTN|nr:lipoprotein-anchoring transpeptidase ErfK/SrfK [Conexibacter arvalis]
MPTRSHTSRARTLLIIAGAIVLLLAAAVGFLGWNANAASDRIPNGVTIGGVHVGGMSAAEARRTLDRAIGRPAQRPVQVEVDGRTVELSAARAGVAISFDAAIERALARGEEGNFLTRGWRELTGGEVDGNETLKVAVKEKAVGAFVDRIAKQVDRPAVDAALAISLDSVTVTRSQDGARLADPRRLRRQLVRALRKPRGERRFAAAVTVVRPEKTTDQVWEATPTVVTVSKSSTTVRVFVRGELTKTYNVAVGSAEYPTPEGQFAVQTMQVDPPWNVPNSEWAGDLAGQVIPGGAPDNPLKERWIGFDGAVGFHGTADVGSIGSAASHGCVRMAPADVIDLYERVAIGTPVMVAA